MIACMRPGDGVWKASPDILENGRFLLSSPTPGETNASLEGLRAMLSRLSTLVLSLPSIVLMRSASSLMYPLLGPRFCGTRLNRHCAFDLLQFEHGCSLASDCASHLIFFRRHSSHARDTLDRFLGGVMSGGSWYWLGAAPGPPAAAMWWSMARCGGRCGGGGGFCG